MGTQKMLRKEEGEEKYKENNTNYLGNSLWDSAQIWN